MTLTAAAVVVVFISTCFKPSHTLKHKVPVSFVSTIPPPRTLLEVTKTRVQNSISSWEKHASHKDRIIIFTDDEPSCDWLLSFSSVVCVVHDCMHETLRIPTMDCIFKAITMHAVTDVLCWLNADIILPSLFSKTIESIFYQIHSEVMVVGQRKDIALDRALTFDEGWERALGDTIEQGSLHMEYGLDYFIFRKSLLRKLPMLQFIVGAWRWDNYWLSQAVLAKDITVVDLTLCLQVLHQGTDAAGDRDADHRVRAGARWNDELTKHASSNLFLLGRTDNADLVVTPDFQLHTNARRSDVVRAARHITEPDGWVTFIHTDVSKVRHWTRWALNERFKNFVFILEECPLHFKKMKRVLCRKSADKEQSEYVEAAGSLTTSHLASEFFLSLFQLKISFIYINSLNSATQQALSNLLPAAQLHRPGCDISLTGKNALAMVQASKKTKLFWKLVIKCQKKGWFGLKGEDAMVTCLVRLAAKPPPGYTLDTCSI